MATILLVESDKRLATTYAQAFQAVGYAVQVAATAQTAIQIADKTCPDMVVLELQLIAHNGVEFLYEFRSYADWQNIPVIILSYVSPDELHKSIGTLKKHLGVSAYCYKPQTTLKRLLKTVDNVLSQASQIA